MLKSIREKYVERLREHYKEHERYAPIAFFGLGFVFDAIMLHRIDEPMVIIQQGLYLIISAALIAVEILKPHAETVTAVEPKTFWARVWQYREAFLHFMLGTLLNSYTIFYFKSASAFTSFIFIALLIGLLIINEFKRFGKSQAQVHVVFLGLCLVSYLVSLAPIVLGFIGVAPFLLANAVAALCFYGYFRALKPKILKLAGGEKMLRTHLIYPFAGVQIVFAALYFAHLIPPVPLSVQYMGIFHDVEKLKGEYRLTYTRSKWRFWQHGDQTFKARPGDSVYCFARVFSPSGFKDQLQVRWLYKDARQGWMPADAIPMPVTGGREEGFRAVTKKNNYQPGEWRVQIETRDGREIGSIDFEIESEPGSEPIEPKFLTL